MVLTSELREMLVGGFINKVYQPIKNELVLRITVPVKEKLSNTQASTENHTLDASSDQLNQGQGPRYKQINLMITLGKFMYAKPKTGPVDVQTGSSRSIPIPGSFAMLLRKHLKNGKITDIYQHEFDRIVVLDIAKQETYQLIIELFGDGNALLVKDNNIIQPLFSHTWSARTLRAGQIYKFPPIKVNPRKLDLPEFNKILTTSNKDLVRTLIMDMDIPGKYSEELCIRAKLDKKSKPDQLTDGDRDKLFELIQELFEMVETEPHALLIYTDDGMTDLVDLVPINLELYDKFHINEMDDFNSAVKQIFDPDSENGELLGHDKREFEKVQVMTDQTSTEVARLKRQLEQQSIALKKFTTQIKNNREFGDAIYNNYQRCEKILNEVTELRTKFEPDEIIQQISETEDIVELNPHEGYLILKMKKIENDGTLDIKLDMRRSVMENANAYYELSKRAKEKLSGTKKALRQTQQGVNDLSNKLDNIKSQDIPRAKPCVRKHFWFEKYHWFVTSAGNIVVGGRDAKSNDQIVKRYLDDKDRYCHADLGGAPSVVIKHDPNMDGSDISDDSLKEACEFALLYSKAWHAKLGAATAYWVKPSQVSKSPQSGEYLGRGAFVIRGKRNYITNLKLQLGLGEIEHEGRKKLMAGPLSAISAHSRSYVVLAPGNIKKNAMAKELSDLFNIVVDDILSILPSGEFALVKKVGIKND